MHSLVKHSPRFDIPIIVLLFSTLFFATIGLRPLANPDEGRYTEIPREMLESGDWVSPRLNGVLYFEKPPLFYWMQALSLKVGGVNEASARFWPAAFALIGCLATYLGGKAVFGRQTGFYSALVLGTSLIYFALSQLVVLDMAVSVLMTSALLVFLVCIREPPGRKRFLLSLAFFALLALATLAKGLIGLALPCSIILLWALLLNQWKLLWPFYPIAGISLFLGLAVPWHYLAWKANPEFAWFYFVNEHFLRYLTPGHGRVQPFWFFFAILGAGLIPWLGLFPQSVARAMKGGMKQARVCPERVFLLVWVVFVLLFFSASDSKLIPYILPVFPAAALLIGNALSEENVLNKPIGTKIGAYVFALFAFLLAFAFPFIAIEKAARVSPYALPWSIAASVTLVCGGFATLVWARGKSYLNRIAIPFATMFMFYLVSNPLAAALKNDSNKELALALDAIGVSCDQIHSLLDYHQDLAPYLRHTLCISVCEPEEQRFGMSLEAGAATWLGKDEFLEVWEGSAPQFAVARRDKAHAFADENPRWEAHLVESSNRYDLITNQSGLALLERQGDHFYVSARGGQSKYSKETLASE